jgi:Kef-type K+ transport system membrane component KefB
MLFEPISSSTAAEVLAVCAIIIFGKSIAAFLLVLALRYPPKTALIVSASLAQIGEFSFILAALGLSLGLMPQEGQSLIWPAPSSPSPSTRWCSAWPSRCCASSATAASPASSNAPPTRWPSCR